jgi:hypothetical protein
MLVELPEDVIQERRWGAGGCGFLLGQNGGKDCGKDVFLYCFMMFDVMFHS